MTVALRQSMSVFHRMLASIGIASVPAAPASNVKDLLKAQPRRPQLNLPPPTAEGLIRVHLFTGYFASLQTAKHYCHYTEDDRPEDIVRDLPHAAFDVSFIEIVFQHIETRLRTILPPADLGEVTDKIGAANTLIIIAEPAFGGLAYALHDTTRLDYLGPFVVKNNQGL